MNNDLRGRFRSKSGKKSPVHTDKAKTDKSDSIFSIWEDQRRMQAEEDKMARELKEAKKKAKELQKTLRKHKFGESKTALNDKTKTVAKKGRKHLKKIKSWIKTNKKKSAGTFVLLVAVVVVLNIATKKDNQVDTLGDSTDFTSQVLPREKPDFQLLYPAGSNEEDFEVVRNNPQSSAPSYVYVDSFPEETVNFQVSQQEVPDNFDLDKVSRDFQATNVIQIDDSKVYHGFSEKAKIQSLMFVKDGKLVLIASPKQYPDEQWAAYIISLN